MAERLFHQCGHNWVWNRRALEDDACGSGLILSPVHTKPSDVHKLDRKTKSRSLFDPQFYLPNSQKKKLKSYPFFPDTIAGDNFQTDDFSLVALKAAELCLEFQVDNGFRALVIPARYLDQMHRDFTERQEVYTVDPFLKVITRRKLKLPVYLTLPLTQHMVLDAGFRTEILNWVTSFPEINGVYLIVGNDSGQKQIQSKNFLVAYLDFLRALRAADLEVLCGYCNTEGLLATLVEGCDITFGSFENTRMFTIDKFVMSDEERRGPKPRIFLPGLLNWIQFSQAKDIREANRKIWARTYDRTQYAENVLNAAVEPYFNQEPLYRHHFIVFSRMCGELRKLSPIDRYKTLRGWLKTALELYAEIDNIPIDLEKHSQGGHIQVWLDVVNEYFRKYLKSAA